MYVNSVAPEYFVINDGGQWQPIECLIALFPHFFASIFTEAILALEEKRLVPVVLLPAIHLLHTHTYIHTYIFTFIPAFLESCLTSRVS